MPCRHQIGEGLRTFVWQFCLIRRRDWQQVACHLLKMRSDDDQPFVSRPTFQFEDALNRLTVIRIATQSVTGFGWVGDETAALEVRGKRAG